MHWYRQKPEQPLKRVLYISSNENVVHEQGISEERYEARKWPSNSLVSLRIHQATEEDAGLYYCACWVEHTLHKRSAVIEQKPPSGQHVAEEIRCLNENHTHTKESGQKHPTPSTPTTAGPAAPAFCLL